MPRIFELSHVCRCDVYREVAEFALTACFDEWPFMFSL
jgi:hypothetical protein